MPIPSHLLPANETARLTALATFDVLAATAEPVFQEFVDLAAHMFNLPIAFISVVDDQHVEFKATHGIPELRTLLREQALCSMPVQQGVTMVLNKILQASASVQQQTATALGLDFYVGSPLLLAGKLAIGAVCVSDKKEREFSSGEEQVLDHLAAVISQTIIVRRNCLRDEQGAQRWQQVQLAVIEVIRELEGLIRYTSQRYELPVPTPTAILLSVRRRLNDISMLLYGAEVN